MSVCINNDFLATSANFNVTLWRMYFDEQNKIHVKKVFKFDEMHIKRVECLHLKITNKKNIEGFIISGGKIVILSILFIIKKISF